MDSDFERRGMPNQIHGIIENVGARFIAPDAGTVPIDATVPDAATAPNAATAYHAVITANKGAINRTPTHRFRLSGCYVAHVAETIGLATIRQQCPRFDTWIKRLETWGTL